MSNKRIGSQQPNFSYTSKYSETDGDLAIELAESYVSKPFE